MAADERVELGDELARGARAPARPRSRSSRHARLLLLEPRLLEPRERLLRTPRAPRRATARAHAAARAAARPSARPCERLATLRRELLEGTQVERVPVEVEAVPGRTCLGSARPAAACAAARRRSAPSSARSPARRRPRGRRRADPPGRPGPRAAAAAPAAPSACLRQLDGPGVVCRLERPENPKVHQLPSWPHYRAARRRRGDAAGLVSLCGKATRSGRASRAAVSRGRGSWCRAARGARRAGVCARGRRRVPFPAGYGASPPIVVERRKACLPPRMEADCARSVPATARRGHRAGGGSRRVRDRDASPTS